MLDLLTLKTRDCLRIHLDITCGFDFTIHCHYFTPVEQGSNESPLVAQEGFEPSRSFEPPVLNQGMSAIPSLGFLCIMSIYTLSNVFSPFRTFHNQLKRCAQPFSSLRIPSFFVSLTGYLRSL